jgi:hypothetical protein
MPVIWGAKIAAKAATWDDIGIAVGCSLCLVYAGQPCVTTTFPLGRGIRAHQQRHDQAETIGFVLVSAALTATPPAISRPSSLLDLFVME